MKCIALGMFSLALCLPIIALGAGTGSSPCKLVKVGDLSVTTTPANEVLVAGELDNRPIQLQVDTGLELSLIDDAPDSEQPMGYSKFKAGGKVHRFAGTLRKEKVGLLRVGDFVARDVEMLHTSERVFHDSVHGSLGANFTGKYDIELDLGNNIFNLFESTKCGEDSPYWASRFSEADVSIAGTEYDIVVEVNGVRTRALLDTGEPRSLITWHLAERLGISPDAPGLMDVQGEDPKGDEKWRPRLFKLSEIKIGDEVVQNPLIEIRDFLRFPFFGGNARAYSDEDMVLGADFIINHHIFISRGDEKMYFTWNGKAIFSPPSQVH